MQSRSRLCLGSAYQGKKKEPCSAAPRPNFLASTLAEQELRYLQSERFCYQSRLITDTIDWLIWLSGEHPQPHYHRLVDRLLEGDDALEAELIAIRQELGA